MEIKFGNFQETTKITVDDMKVGELYEATYDGNIEVITKQGNDLDGVICFESSGRICRIDREFVRTKYKINRKLNPGESIVISQ